VLDSGPAVVVKIVASLWQINLKIVFIVLQMAVRIELWSVGSEGFINFILFG